MCERPHLGRLLDPRTIAIVGVSESSTVAETAARALNGPAEVFFVHPTRSSVFGRATVPSLTAIGRPVDAVLSLAGAAVSVEVAEEAATCGAGGLVVIASGFAEAGAEGRELQDRLEGAAVRGGFPVVGPNCAGFARVSRGIDLTMLATFARRRGGVSVIAQSGAVLAAISAGAHRPGGIGLDLLVSSGNEAVTDTADYLEYIVRDPGTKVILLAIEAIRRPEAFFRAARAAREAGKPIIALKIGRSSRHAEMARSHTGALSGDAWVYDVAFRQANILIAHDIGEMVDRAQLFDQLSRDNWRPVRGLAVLGGSGGIAAVAADLAESEGIDLASSPELDRWVTAAIPGATVANPLDARGLAPAPLWEEIFRRFAAAPEIDTYLYIGQFADWDERAKTRVAQLMASPIPAAGPLIISPFAGHAGTWLEPFRSDSLAIGNGAREVMQGLASMATFMRSDPSRFVRPAGEIPAAEPGALRGASVDRDGLVPFDAAMRLLTDAGIPTAPFHVVAAGAEVGDPGFAGPYVVKLADVAHRSDHGAIVVGVHGAGLPAAVARLRAIARTAGFPERVVVQPVIAGHAEAFIGLRGETDLGPLVVFGVGGIFVEVLRRVGGRIAPFDVATADALLAEFDDLRLFGGVRGRPAWDRTQLCRLLVAAGDLITGARRAVVSVDINPLIVCDRGYVAVDALVQVRAAGSTEAR